MLDSTHLRALRLCRGAFRSAGVGDGVSGRNLRPSREVGAFWADSSKGASQRLEVNFPGLVGFWKCQAVLQSKLDKEDGVSHHIGSC